VLFKFWILVRSAYDLKEKKKKEKKKRIEERRHDATKDNGRNENERVCMVGCLKP
jgi:plasmid maintenance system antidote protein VapI